ncbi:MAG: rod shape-determining protein [Hydrotalea sp.]|nr:rod shape-determining protein [Hydrotalea sp.]
MDKKNRLQRPTNALKSGWEDFSKSFDNEPFAVLSLGSETIRIAIFCRDKNNRPLLMGFGTAPSLGIKNGFIVDLRACRDRALAALSQAEQNAEHHLKKITVLFSGPSPAVVMKKYNLTLNGSAVTRRHLLALNQKFWSPKMVGDYHLLYPIPFDYRLDNSPALKNPLGLVGQKLSLTMAMIYEERHALENIDGLLQKINLRPSWLLDEAMASALGMTAVDEQEMGALSLHIGAETTNIAVIKNFCPIFLYRLPIGGRALTLALAKNLGLDVKTAEAVKRSFGDITGQNGQLSFATTNPLLPKIDEAAAMAVVTAYLSNLINQVTGVLEKYNINYRQLAVLSLSGGGTKLKGLDQLLREKLNRRVRTTPANPLSNLPRHADGTEFAGMVGAALFIIKKQLNQQQMPKPSLLRNLVAWARKNYG